MWKCVCGGTDGIVGLLGYLTYGNNVASNILVKNYPDDNVAVALARVAESIVVSVCIPLQFHPARKCWINLVQLVSQLCDRPVQLVDPADGTLQPVAYWMTTLLMVTVIYLTGLFVSDLGIVMTITGSVGAIAITYTLPGVFYWKLFGHESARHWWGGVVLAIFGGVMTILTLIAIFI